MDFNVKKYLESTALNHRGILYSFLMWYLRKQKTIYSIY